MPLHATAALAVTDKAKPAAPGKGSALSPHLQRLEDEAIHIMREVFAEFRKPVMLYSVGKDSSVMLHLARKAFHPAPPPFPFLHIATGWDFQALLDHRDRMARAYGLDLLVHGNTDAAKAGVNPFDTETGEYSRLMLTEALKAALGRYGFDAALGGGRRDDEKSRAKERIFSHRGPGHIWEPRNQRPELWRLFNTRLAPGDGMRVFPLSNWTEMDVWEYIKTEQLEVPNIYFSHERDCFRRGGQWLPVPPPRTDVAKPDPYAGARPTAKEPLKTMVCRVRTIADMISTGMIDSPAITVDDIIREVAAARVTERGTRADDKASEAAMEDRKKAGYF